MFSIFTDMNWYLYTLSYNRNTFYVGITTWPKNRYKQHCTYGQGNVTYNYIYWLLEAGELPDIDIIECYENGADAAIAESALINYFIINKHKICNGDQNPNWNRIITCVPTKRINRRQKPGYANFIDNKTNNSHILTNEKRFNRS